MIKHSFIQSQINLWLPADWELHSFILSKVNLWLSADVQFYPVTSNLMTAYYTGSSIHSKLIMTA